MPLSNYPSPTAMVQMLYESSTVYLMRSYPIKDLPLNIRPGIVFATATWLLLLGILGMAPLPSLPVNDKALHFFGLGFATFLLYFILDVPEGPARRVWYIRRAPLILTLVAGFLLGGIVSEFVQATLPWKVFQFGDIVANLLGSSLFLYLAHLLWQRNRKRQEISSLYQPLSAQGSATYRDAQGRQHNFDVAASEGDAAAHGGRRQGPYRDRDTDRYGDSNWDRDRDRAGQQNHGSGVWDEESLRGSVDSPMERSKEPVFDLGDDDGDEPPESGRD